MVAARAFANGRRRQGAGGADQVVRHGRDRQPGRVRREHPGWHVSQGAAGDVGEDLLHDGVVAVLAFGLEHGYLELSRQPGL